MKKKFLSFVLAFAVLFTGINLAQAVTPVQWDGAGGLLQPLATFRSALIKASKYQATSTTASIFPYASTTVTSATTFCLSTDCISAWTQGLTSYDAWTHPSAGKSATTSEIQVTGGFLSTASSTFSSTLHLNNADGGLAIFGGLVSSGATTTAGTGLTYSGNAFNVNSSQSIGTLSNLTSDGFVYTSGGAGTLNVQTFPCTLAQGCTGLSSLTGNRILYSDSAGTSLLQVATSTLNLGVSGGGTGAVTLTGCLTGNGTGAITGSGTCNTSNATMSSLTVGEGLLGGTITTSGTIYGQLGTSTLPVISNIPYFTSLGTASAPAKFANVATSTNGTANTIATFDSAGRISPVYASTTASSFSQSLVGTRSTFTGALSPIRSFVLGTATTTTWTASTTASGYLPFLVMPFTGTIQQTRCVTDASFVGVNVQIAGSNVTPSYFVASTTVGVEKFTSGNTFTAGQKVSADFGTTTTATTKSVACTFDITETP